MFSGASMLRKHLAYVKSSCECDTADPQPNHAPSFIPHGFTQHY
jgi:hypothetical protein